MVFLLVRPKNVPAPSGILRTGPPKKTTKNEKSLSTRTGPTLQKEQFKHFNFLGENLLRVDTKNFLGGSVSGPVQVL